MIVISSYFAEYRLFYRALLQKRPVILRSLLIGILLIVIDYHGAVMIVMKEYQNRMIEYQNRDDKIPK